jgi:hypothetical protein
MQQAKSSALRRHGLASEQLVEPSRQEREASVHPEHAQLNKAASVRERIINNRAPQDDCDNIIERRRHNMVMVQLEATTSTEAGATTAQRIEALHPSH